jgi:hypothetical protein
MDTRIVRVIYEHGITAQVIGSDWYIINISGGRTERIDNPGIIELRYNVRPVVVTQFKINMLLQNINHAPFGIKITDWEQYAYKLKPAPKLDTILNTAYLLRATEYHCIQLALLYLDACEQTKKNSDITGNNLATGDQKDVIYSGNNEIYYEFDALITAVRRTYDSCRYLLWHFFGSRDTLPSSFYRTIKKCKDLPIELEEKLVESWSKHGEEITTYRDCIQHYVPIDFGIGSLRMHKLDNGAWSTQALIPDNPLAKSRFKFVHADKQDALTYGWEAANEVLEIATSIIQSIPLP